MGLYPDLLFHYGTDLTKVIAGEGPVPSLVLLQVQRLPDTSLTSALMQGGEQFFGWGMDRHLAAATFDAINTNTKATGHWQKGKAPKFPVWPRPQDKRTPVNGEKKKVTVADLWKKFSNRK